MLALLFLACAPLGADSPGPRAPCGVGELRDDEGSCVPEACGPAEYGAISTADVYVHPGDDLAAAIDALGSGTVALAAGTYFAALAFQAEDDDITVVGRCRELVTLDASGQGSGAAGVDISSQAGHTFALADLTVTGAERFGISVEAAALTLSRVDIVANTVAGLSIGADGVVVVEDVRVADTLPGRTGIGDGVSLDRGSRLEGGELVVHNSVGGGISGSGATLVLSGLTVSDTQPTAEGVYGAGLELFGGANLSLTHAVLSGNMTGGLTLSDAGTVAMLADVEISGTEIAPEFDQSIAMFVLDGAVVEANGVRLIGNSQYGIVVSGGTLDISDLEVDGGALGRVADATALLAADGASITARNVRIRGSGGVGIAAGADSTLDVVGCDVRDPVATERGPITHGAEFGEGAVATLSDCTFTRAIEAAINVRDIGTDVTLDHVTIRDTTRSPWDGRGGVALLAAAGAHVSARDLVVSGAELYAVGSTGEGTYVDIDRTRIDHVAPDGSGAGGMALSAREAGVLEARNAALTDLTRFAVEVTTAGTLRLSDAVIAHVRADGEILVGGGAYVDGGGHAEFRRVRVEDVVGIGVLATGAGTSVAGVDVVLSDIALSPAGLGTGVQASEGALVSLTRAEIIGASGAAVFVLGPGTRGILDACTFRDTHAQSTGSAYHLTVYDGGGVSARNLVIEGGVGAGLLATGADASALVDGLSISGVTLSPTYADAFGVAVQLGGVVTLARASISGVDGPGLVVLEDGDLSCVACDLGGNATAGAVVSAGRLVLRDSSIHDTRPGRALGGGVGILVVEDVGGGEVDAERIVVSDNALAALWQEGASHVAVRDSTLTGGPGITIREGLYAQGNAVFARGVDGVTGTLTLSGTTLGGASVALLLEGATADIASAVWSANGVDVASQQCGVLPPPSDVSGAIVDLCPAAERLTLPMEFDTVLLEPAGASE